MHSDVIVNSDRLLGGQTGWRLPSAFNQDGSSPVLGWNVTGSEMGHLFYVELGNKVQFDPNTGYMVDSGLLNKGPFTDLQRNLYWSGTSTGPGFAWVFGFGPNFGSEYDPFFIGFQYQPRNTDGVFALAVHSGNVGVSTVPEPATLWLLGPCLAGLAAMKVFGERNTKFGNTCYVP